MKNYLLILLSFFCFFNGFSQNKIAEKIQQLQIENKRFAPFSTLTKDNSISKNDIDKVLTEVTLAKVDLEKINQIASGQYEFIELDIPYNNQTINIQLYQVDPFAEGFRLDTDKNIDIPYQKGVYYRGIINGNSNSISAFNFFNGEFNGIISSNELGNIVIGKIDKPNNEKDYIIYSDNNLKVLNNFECHVKEDKLSNQVSTLSREVNTAKCITMYFEVDNNLFVLNDSDITTSTNWVTSVFNNVQTLFNNDGITTALKSIYIWTTPDPYQGAGNNSNDYLVAFANNRPVFNADVGMLLGIDGGLGGVAFLNSVCTTINYAYSDLYGISFSSVPTYSWTVEVITHEFGHSLGSPHTHGCYWNGNGTAIDGCGQQAGFVEGNCATGPIPSTTVKGTIMSYCHLISGVGINFSNGFGPQPAALIVNTINNKSCLSSDCINTCINTVANIQIVNVNEDSVTITWEDLNTNISSWQISVTPFDSIPVWNNVSEATFSISGLAQNSYYVIFIRPFCIETTTTNRKKIFATGGDYCGGMLFTDTGNIAESYTNMELFTRTFIPNLPNRKITVTFSQFNLEVDYDYLYIYNGSDDTYPEFNNGNGFTGTNSPETITSSAIDGSLTFKFYSDQGVVDSGWIATVSCQENLGVNSTDFIDFTYYPNPAKNTITLQSNTTITEIDIYNIEGRKLFAKKLDTLESNVDLSQFTSGTYFFKIKFNDVEKNFKVLKL